MMQTDSKGKERRILQVNLNGEGGAFALMTQIQQELYPEIIFDYYWMGNYKKKMISFYKRTYKSVFYEAGLRKNRFLGHILLPFVFYQFLIKNSYRIVHIHADTAYKMFLYAYAAKRTGIAKVIMHSHSSGINGQVPFIKYIAHIVSRPFLSSYADVLLTCSKKASRWMFLKHQSQAVMIKNGVNLRKFRYDDAMRRKVRKELNIHNRLIGMVGNLSYQKYPEYMIDIFEKICMDGYTLLFAGDGPNRRQVEEYAKKHNVYDHIIFYGRTNRIHELLNAMDLFIMTSRFEGLPVSAVEAQANGLRCILSDKVTKEVKILPNCEFASIDEGTGHWEELIRKENIMPNRSEGVIRLKRAGFDICDTSKQLKYLYDNE